MPIVIDSAYVNRLSDLIEAKKSSDILKMMEPLHPADIAEILEEISLEEARFIYLLLDGEVASDVLMQLQDDDRQKLMNSFSSDIISSQFLHHMDSDDAADILGALSEEKRNDVLGKIEDLERASDIIDLLKYDEDSAGGLMATELVKVNENWTVQTCLKEISRQAEDIDEIYYVYVVDDKSVLKGVLSLKKLILNPTSTIISSIYLDEVISVKTDLSSEEVALVMSKYDLVALPVVDSIGILKGRITIDDAVHVIQEEAEKDFQRATGISEDVESSDGLKLQVRARLPWLLVGMVGGLFGARLIGGFDEALKLYPELAIFFPLIGAMGGNVGVQASSIVVQGLASHKLLSGGLVSKLLKEFSVALVNGLVISLCILSYNLLMDTSLALTVTVSCAIFGVIILASIFGTLIPLVLDKIKIDPAVATGPLITTFNDILGLLIYLLTASYAFEMLKGVG